MKKLAISIITALSFVWSPLALAEYEGKISWDYGFKCKESPEAMAAINSTMKLYDTSTNVDNMYKGCLGPDLSVLAVKAGKKIWEGLDWLYDNAIKPAYNGIKWVVVEGADGVKRVGIWIYREGLKPVYKELTSMEVCMAPDVATGNRADIPGYVAEIKNSQTCRDAYKVAEKHGLDVEDERKNGSELFKAFSRDWLKDYDKVTKSCDNAANLSSKKRKKLRKKMAKLLKKSQKLRTPGGMLDKYIPQSRQHKHIDEAYEYSKLVNSKLDEVSMLKDTCAPKAQKSRSDKSAANDFLNAI